MSQSLQELKSEFTILRARLSESAEPEETVSIQREMKEVKGKIQALE